MSNCTSTLHAYFAGKEELERYLSDILDEQEVVFGYKSEKVDANIRLKDLVKYACEQPTTVAVWA